MGSDRFQNLVPRPGAAQLMQCAVRQNSAVRQLTEYEARGDAERHGKSTNGGVVGTEALELGFAVSRHDHLGGKVVRLLLAGIVAFCKQSPGVAQASTAARLESGSDKFGIR